MSGQPFYAALKAALAADLRPTEKLVLISILEKANDATANCAHSNETIAAGLGIKRQQVDRAVKELIAKGFVERPERSRQPWHKLVRMQQIVAATDRCIQCNDSLHSTQQIVASDATNSCTNVLSSLTPSIFSIGASPENPPEPTPKPQPQQKKRTAPKQRSVFVPPSVEDVKALMIERGWDDDKAESEAESFHAHYDARDWTFKGGVKMKRWQSAVTTWMTNRRNWDWEKKQKDDPFAAIRRTFTIEEMRAMEAADG